MDLYPLGQPIRVPITVRDVSGALANATAVTLALYLNSALVQTYSGASVTNDGTGLYHVDLPTTDTDVAGHYRNIPTATGSNAGVDFDVFDVFDPATYPRLVSFADAKTFIGAQGTANDALIDRMVGWASARILREVVAYNSTYTQTVTARGGRLTLSRTPVRSVTAVTSLNTGATGLTAADLVVVNPLYGIVAPNTGAAACGTYQVTYTAGYDEVPPGVDGACFALVQHWWTQSQAHGSATYGDGGFVPDFKGLPHAVKNKLDVVPTPLLMA